MKAQNFLAKNPTEWDDDPSYHKLKTAVTNESSNEIMTVQIRYSTIEQFKVDSKAEYTA